MLNLEKMEGDIDEHDMVKHIKLIPEILWNGGDNKMSRNVKGFYRDKKGRIRPITPRIRNLPVYEVMNPHREEDGYWVEMNGERVLMPNYKPPKVKESDIYEEQTLDVDLLLKDDRGEKLVRHKQELAKQFEAQVRGLRNEWYEVHNQKDRDDIVKRISYLQDKIKEVLNYGIKNRASNSPHLYRNGVASHERRKFEKEYGKKKGDYVYGAVVGKVRRERLAKGRQ